MAVDRCVCHAVTLAELKELARTHDLDLEGLAQRTGAGTNCGCCRPYIRRMLDTGETRLPVIKDPRQP
jgi:bacterioferritin-associated ferredoxin